MVLAGKIFRVREKVELDSLAAKLKDFKREEAYVEENFQHRLVTEVQRLNKTSLGLEGILSFDKILHIPHRGELVPVPRTFLAPFLFTEYGGKLLLTILEKKWRANNFANLLSEALFTTVGYVVEVKIPAENLRSYHEENPEGTKVIFFSNVDIPNVRKLSLYGASLANASLYGEFLSHGNIWYVVVTSKRYGYVVGITGNGIVTIFNRVEPKDFLTYTTEEVFPLIEMPEE
ncbi:hypothetical protein [Candidatus Hecatella orcuttiae]|jgi:hypothetical protein|uniref:hypothetical protein n=1 Tax=Candidatus Hecatella orcuttiae TaxID=1935119 RepID=UPI0028681E41|nr:hypothetical protein [Candidatus Hecatella orcuttiae]